MGPGCGGCKIDAICGGAGCKEVHAEKEAMKHDLERHMQISSEYIAEIDALKKARDEWVMYAASCDKQNEELRKLIQKISKPRAGIMDKLFDEVDQLKADNEKLRQFSNFALDNVGPSFRLREKAAEIGLITQSATWGAKTKLLTGEPG